MMIEKRNFKDRLKGLGIEIVTAAKREYNAALTGAEKQIKKEKIRKRFNLENPYKFILLDDTKRIKWLDKFFARHAKRYDEDDILVFFGTQKENHFKPHQRIKDLSDESIMEIIEVVDVSIPVKLEEDVIDTPCTAVYGRLL